MKRYIITRLIGYSNCLHVVVDADSREEALKIFHTDYPEDDHCEIEPENEEFPIDAMEPDDPRDYDYY